MAGGQSATQACGSTGVGYGSGTFATAITVGGNPLLGSSLAEHRDRRRSPETAHDRVTVITCKVLILLRNVILPNVLYVTLSG